MKCPKCGSENVTVSVINEQHFEKKHHGLIWWLFIGWWWFPIKWLFFTLPALIIAIFAPKKKIVNTQKTVCVCQNCAHRWDMK